MQQHSSLAKTRVFGSDSRDDLQQYLYEVSQIEPMTDQELEEAMYCIRRGEPNQEDTRKRLAEHHLWLVIPCARRHRRLFQNMSLLDLIQEGNTALLLAAHNYQGKGPFPPYAARYISTSMLQAIPKDGAIQISHHLYFRERRAGRTADLSIRHACSLDEEREDGWSRYDELAAAPTEQPDNQDDQEQIRQRVQQLLNTLDEREATLIGLRYGLGDSTHTQAAAARRLGISPTTARRVEAQATAKLRRASYSIAV